MRTRFELVLPGANEARLRAVGEAALAEIEDTERRLSFFDPGSSISRVNREAHRRWVEVDADTFELLQMCVDVHHASGGAFDVTIGPMMRILFHRRGDTPPSDAAIADAARAVGMDGVALDPERRAVRFERPGMAVDLGAVGKGHALDLAAGVLAEHGIRCGLLHGGTSTVVALGAPPSQPGWRVQLGADTTACAVLRDGSLSVSGQHGRQTTHHGVPLGHVLDPRRRSGPRDAVLAAVLAPRAQCADAWSTALLAHGEPFESVGSHRGAVLTASIASTTSYFEPSTTQLSA